jgi:hypothetical protein
MRNYLIILAFLIGQNINCQEFKFNLFFQDSKGNKDTLTLGYDTNATDSIDSKLGETNIYKQPIDSVFDVRISNIWYKSAYKPIVDSFQTKRQIVKDNCGGWFPAVTIDLFCKYWPVTITWDNTVFKDSCNLGSILTSFHPGGWFDVGGGFITELGKVSEMKIQKLKQYNENSTQYYYVNDKNDTIYVFWQAFGNSQLPHLEINDNKFQTDYNFYPNPSNGITYLKGDIQQVQSLSLFDITGNMRLSVSDSKIDLTNLNQGVYLVNIKLKNGRVLNRKIINAR